MTESKSRILVADDERNIRKNLAMVLEAAGYWVDDAAESRLIYVQLSYFFRLRQSVEPSMPRMAAASSKVGDRPTTRVMCSRSISSKEKFPPTCGASADLTRAEM